MENEEEIKDDVIDVDVHDTDTDDEVDVQEILRKNAELEGRLKRAETKLAKTKETKTETTQNNTDLTGKDLLAIMNAKVDAEDLDVVTEYATFKKISVAEALKSSIVLNTLKEKAEMRRTAEVSHTGSSRISTNKVSDEQILEKARSGKLSDGDIDRLVNIRV